MSDNKKAKKSLDEILKSKKTVEKDPKQVSLSEDVNEEELARIKENESKDSLTKMQAVKEARLKLSDDSEKKSSGKLQLGTLDLDDEVEENEAILELKNRRNKQKEIESDMLVKKESDLSQKLKEASKEFGGMVEPQKTRQTPQESKIELLAQQIEELEENNEILNQTLDKAENVELDGVRVYNPETFELADEFINYVNSLKASPKEVEVIKEVPVEVVKEVPVEVVKEVEGRPVLGHLQLRLQGAAVRGGVRGGLPVLGVAVPQAAEEAPVHRRPVCSGHRYAAGLCVPARAALVGAGHRRVLLHRCGQAALRRHRLQLPEPRAGGPCHSAGQLCHRHDHLDPAHQQDRYRGVHRHASGHHEGRHRGEVHRADHQLLRGRYVHRPCGRLSG